MKKKREKQNYLRIILLSFALLCLVGILLLLLRPYLLARDNYFINFEDSEEVREFIASEFLIGETTRIEVENALADGILGDLDCDYEYFTDGISCEALGSSAFLFPKYYLITLGFTGDILTLVKVDSFVNAP